MYTLRFFSSKCSLFHNSNIFVSCIIHILYTECAKIKKMIPASKVKKLDPRKAYKYLGIEESFDIQHKNQKEQLKKEYFRRLRLVLGAELNTSNWIIGSTSTQIQFGIINWHQEELQKLDRKTRKLLTIHGQHHPKADVDRLYVPRKQGGGGLMQLEAAHAVEITKLVEFLDRKEDPLIQVVRTH